MISLNYSLNTCGMLMLLLAAYLSIAVYTRFILSISELSWDISILRKKTLFAVSMDFIPRITFTLPLQRKWKMIFLFIFKKLLKYESKNRILSLTLIVLVKKITNGSTFLFVRFQMVPKAVATVVQATFNCYKLVLLKSTRKWKMIFLFIFKNCWSMSLRTEYWA